VLFDEITISNVGTFRDNHVLQLAPPSPKQPIILVGGLNGTGKTTLLDSIQLALYGKRARCSNRGTLPYEEYLRRSISNTAGEGIASIALQFRQWSEGQEQTYRVCRSWSVTPNGVAERVEVALNNRLDRVLTDTWSDFVEELIPIEIAQLFFFDGEKIEGFADLETSTQLLSRAVHSLLGLDLINRLTADLVGLERRKQVALKSDVERHQIDIAQAEISRLEEQREALFGQRASKQNELDRRLKHQREVEALYNKSGGPLFEKREALETERQTVSHQLESEDKELRDYAEGAAPLLLVQDLLSRTHEQSLRENTATEAQIVNRVLSQRDQEILDLARSAKIASDAFSSLAAFLADDRKKRDLTVLQSARYLNLSPEGAADLRSLRSREFAQLARRISELMKRAEQLQARIIDLDRKLAGIPAKEVFEDVFSKRRSAQIAVEQSQASLAVVDAELERITGERDQKQARLVVRIEEAVEQQFENREAQRIVSYSQRARQTIERFRSELVGTHVNRIAGLIFDSFRRLLRKDTLVSGLSIDRGTFALDLRGSEGKPLSGDRLSAGERQLLAVSMLWGLARASGRPLPVVIDTPLGRLDSQHRGKIVNGYFPHASHQVILLSTDEEIDEHYFEELKPFIGHAYRLEYDDRLGSSQVKQGYLW
jgi:DNA sulfur modification protein DndD